MLFGGTGTESLNVSQPEFYPERLESGTLNLPAIAALGEAAENVAPNLKIFSETLFTLTDALIGELKKIDGVRIYSEPNRFGIVSFSSAAAPSAAVADVLSSEYDIAVRGGLHCAPLVHKSLGTEREGSGAREFRPAEFPAGNFRVRQGDAPHFPRIGALKGARPGEPDGRGLRRNAAGYIFFSCSTIFLSMARFFASSIGESMEGKAVYIRIAQRAVPLALFRLLHDRPHKFGLRRAVVLARKRGDEIGEIVAAALIFAPVVPAAAAAVRVTSEILHLFSSFAAS